MNYKACINALIKLLGFLPVGHELFLADDSFETGYMSGKDKLFGFRREKNGELFAVGNQGTYPVEDMGQKTLEKLFRTPTPILIKIQDRTYDVQPFVSTQDVDKQALMDLVVEQIEKDIREGDTNSLYGLLNYLDSETLVAFLPEEDWGKILD